MMESSDNDDNENSTSSRDPLNHENISEPPRSGGPPPYEHNPPGYQEAVGLLSPQANIVNDGEAPPNYMELTRLPRITSAGSVSISISTPNVRMVDPADVEASRDLTNVDEERIDGEAETAIGGSEEEIPPEEVPATNVSNVEEGSDGRRNRFNELLERLKKRQRFLIIFPIVLACFVIFIATFPVSFHYIHYYEIALKRSVWTGWVDFKTVYDDGCYVIGPEMEFIRFEAAQQTINTELSVTSSSSLSYKLRLVVIYQLKKSDLPTLYRKYAGQHRDVLERVIAATAKNRAVTIHVDSWMHDRRNMERALENAVATVLVSDFHVDVRRVYLLDIIFPSALLSRLMAQEELILKSQTAEYNLNERVEQMISKQQTMDIDNSANEVAQDAYARADYIHRIANAESKLITTNTLAQSLLDFRTNMSLTNNEQLMSAFMFANLRTMAANNRLLVAQKNSTKAVYNKRDGTSFADSLAMAAAATILPTTP